jgi:glycosyltransferase involved in cell wall biosynthesis
VFGLAAHNNGRFLAEAIESLLRQTDPDFALIVVDDCSTDATQEVARRYAAFDARVTYERNEERLGLVSTWRRAVELASIRYPNAPYFAWASDHDVWHPEWLERLMAELDADRATVLAYPYGAAISEMGEDLPWRPKKFDNREIRGRQQRVLAAIAGVSAGWAAYGLFRADTLRRCGIYRDVLLPDRLLMAELSLHGSIRLVDRPLWFRRYRRGEVASHGRQRRTLFRPGRTPWYSWLPWWAPHAAVLFWTSVVRRHQAADVSRREGLALSARYAIDAWLYAAKDYVLLRWWKGAKKKQRRLSRIAHRHFKLATGHVKRTRLGKIARRAEKDLSGWRGDVARRGRRTIKRSRKALRTWKRRVRSTALFALRFLRLSRGARM